MEGEEERAKGERWRAGSGPVSVSVSATAGSSSSASHVGVKASFVSFFFSFFFVKLCVIQDGMTGRGNRPFYFCKFKRLLKKFRTEWKHKTKHISFEYRFQTRA